MTEPKNMRVTFTCGGESVTRTAEGKNPHRTTLSVFAALSEEERDVLDLEDGAEVEVEVAYEVTVRKAATFTVAMTPTLVAAGGFRAVKG